MTLATYEEVVDAEIVPDEISQQEARELTDRIRVDLESVWQTVVEAYTRGAHRALGYASWDSYCTTEFGSNRISIPREERAETVLSLRESGLSPKSIASATGLSRTTVRRSLDESGWPNGHPEETLGQDGKTYTRPEPSVSERDWPEVPKPNQRRDENRDTDLANGARNDMTAFAWRYIDYVKAVGKNMPKENISPAATEHIIKAMRDTLADITAATEVAINKLEGEGK